MNTLDILILVLILIPALLGLKNGLLRSIFSLIGIIGGLFLATRYNDKLTSFFSFLKLEPKLISLISFVSIIILCYFVSVYIAGKISKINVITKSFDKILGAIFGIFKGLIIASLFLTVSTRAFRLFGPQTIDSSRFYTSVIDIAPYVYDNIIKYFPDATHFYEELNHKLFFESM